MCRSLVLPELTKPGTWARRSDMCGIAGIYHFEPDRPVDRGLLERMCSVLRHRGPDDEGYYVSGGAGLGHRRLSIIDLANGRQPMSNEDGSLWIIFNGEIYNYVELAAGLRSRGHTLRTQSDTEVILHLYEERGPDCLEELLGMFAFAIWDGRRKEVFLARDRLGIKPLYYFINQSKLIFASEIKAILEDEMVPRRPDYGAITQYLRHMYTTNDCTFFDGIKKLLPGHYMVVKQGRSQIRQYWDLCFHSGQEHPESFYVQRLYELLHDSVRLHLRSDVPLGSHLSGGLDSSSLVGLASSMLPHPLKTFSGAFAEGGVYDERKYINLVAARFGTDHYETVPTAQEYADAWPKIVWHMDEPTIGSAVICHYFVCRIASRHVKVVLGGQGGDELFGGYYRYIPAYLSGYAGLLLSGKVTLGETGRTASNLLGYVSSVGLRNLRRKVRRRKGMLDIVTGDFRKVAQEHTHQDGAAALEAHQDRLNRMLYWDIKHYLPGLLHLEDRTSMSVSIESRVPFLDHRIVEFAASVPARIKMKELRLKHIEREVARRFLPMEVVDRKDKQGFYPPTPVWFKRELLPMIQDIVRSRSFRERGIFDIALLEGQMENYVRGKTDYSEQIWMALNVELWHQQFIDTNSRHRYVETRGLA